MHPEGGNRTRAILDSSSDWEVVELRRRAHAGVWAARTALVLSVPFAMTAWALGEEHAWFMYMLLPTIAAFFSGVFFGAAICKRGEVTDEPLAGRQGALVALMTYVIFAAEVAALSFDPLQAGLDAFMFSLLVSGWLVFPVSFLAGILAFRAREGAYRFSHSVQA
jgi:hypothetical protein